MQSYEISEEPVVARLQPFGDKSIYHRFGRQSRIIHIRGLFAGNTKKENILALSYNNSRYTLDTPWGSIPNLVCAKVSVSALKSTYQTFDFDANCEDPVYEFDMELWAEE